MKDYFKIVVIHDKESDKRILSYVRDAGSFERLPQNETEEIHNLEIKRYFFSSETKAHDFVMSYMNIYYDTILVN